MSLKLLLLLLRALNSLISHISARSPADKPAKLSTSRAAQLDVARATCQWTASILTRAPANLGPIWAACAASGGAADASWPRLSGPRTWPAGERAHLPAFRPIAEPSISRSKDWLSAWRGASCLLSDSIVVLQEAARSAGPRSQPARPTPRASLPRLALTCANQLEFSLS